MSFESLQFNKKCATKYVLISNAVHVWNCTALFAHDISLANTS